MNRKANPLRQKTNYARFIEIEAGSIKRIAPEARQAASAIDNLEYAISDIRALEPKSLPIYLMLHPIVVFPDTGSSYQCVGGFRSLQITRNLLTPKDAISVLLLDESMRQHAEQISQIDILLTHLMASLRPDDGAKQLTALWSAINPDICKKLLPKFNKEKFSKLLGVNRRNFSRKRPLEKVPNDD